MPKATGKEIPEKLKPFNFLGLDMKWEGKPVAEADCPFCGKEDHFFIKIETGQWQCKICGGPSDKGGGNIYSFIREIHKLSMEQTPEDDLEAVAEERKIPSYILSEWGLCKSILDHDWMMPGYCIQPDTSGNRNINILYRWVMAGSKRKALCMPGLDHCLGGVQFWDDTKKDVFVQEGYFDGMAMRYALSRFKLANGVLVPTSKPYETLLATTNVVAVPGCEVFKEQWVSIFKGKNVYLGYDNDYPRRDKKTTEFRLVRGKKVIPGYDGMEKAAKMLSGIANHIKMIDWGAEGFTEELTDGFDTRDYLTTEVYNNA